jgi:two-component system, NtrC family, sensor kinase
MEAVRKSWFRRKSLFGKYVVSFVGLVVLVLAINGGLETWFMYSEITQLLANAQSDKAEATTRRIEQYISELERQISWTTRASATSLERRSDYAQLLQQAPAIDRVIQLDGAGKEQLRVTRGNVVVASGVDYSGTPRFKETQGKSVWLSPVYFDGLEPFMTIAMAHSGRNAGSTVAEVNLKFLATFIEPDLIGKENEAYILGPTGRLLAHSSSSRRLGMDLGELPQVVAELKEGAEPVTFGKDPDGSSVLTAAAGLDRLSWHIFFEQPLRTALQPVYNLLYRTGALLAVGILLAVLAGMLLARQMTVPIRALQVGARQLESSNFGHRIKVKAADEIEELAERFNHMADQLQESYGRLEQKVAERTRDLQQTVRELDKKGHELAIANSHKDQFFANMSHELRTPLNGMLGFSELLVDGLYGNLPDKALEILDLIQKDGRHLLSLINDVLDISKIDAGQLKLSLDDYSLGAIVDTVVATTGSLARAKDIEVKAVVPPDLPVGRGDERRLTQVLLNIVGNAIKFTDTGSVEIRVNAVNGHFNIAVQDTGPGIPPEHQGRIFEEFQQVDNSSTRQKGGTGLGLSISRRLINVHGGNIELQSTLGVGSTFNIIVPVRVIEQGQAA